MLNLVLRDRLAVEKARKCRLRSRDVLRLAGLENVMFF